VKSNLCRKAQGVNLVGQAIGAPKMPIKKDDSGTERFLEYFYKECVHILFRPLVELLEWKSCRGLFCFLPVIRSFYLSSLLSEDVLALTREQANRYVYLCDLLYNFIQQHNFRSNFYVLSSNNILSRVATLLRAKDKYLRHGTSSIIHSRQIVQL
jgi:protein phosphatase-4 regulatory subunit 3